jgi:hypothetical protein
MKMRKKYDLPCLSPVMGPWLLNDSMGMKTLMAMLDRSLDKGDYEVTAQWDTTFRCTMFAVSNISLAAVGGMEDSLGAYKHNRMFISGVMTHKFWYARFMAGVHKPVGHIRKLDKEVTVKVFHAIDMILDMEWGNTTMTNKKKRIVEMGAWFIGWWLLYGLSPRGDDIAGTHLHCKQLGKYEQCERCSLSLCHPRLHKGELALGYNLGNPLHASHGGDPFETWTLG